MKRRKNIQESTPQRKSLWRELLTAVIAVLGFFLATFNTYWIHLRSSESISMTIMDFSARDPQPTNAYFVVEAILINSGNKQSAITDCTLMMSENTNEQSYAYWPWDRKDALVLPAQQMQTLRIRYGKLAFNEFHDRWPNGQNVKVKLEVLVVDSRGLTHKVLVPLDDVSWNHGLAFQANGYPKTAILLPSPIHNDPFPLSRRNE